MTIAGSTYSYIRDLVREHSAMILNEDQDYLIKNRLELLAYDRGIDSLDELVNQLQEKPYGELHSEVISAIAINETSFFRDKHVFEVFIETIVPELIERRQREREINIWSAACASGQEPFSIAMLLKEYPVPADWRLRLIGSDISGKALSRAAEGIYSQLEVERGLSAALLQKYFHRQEKLWRIDASVRDMVEFININLSKPWYHLPDMDVIFLRNILIYFDTPTKRGLLERMAGMLKPGGYLVIGAAETIINLGARFDLLRAGNAVYYRLCNNQH